MVALPQPTPPPPRGQRIVVERKAAAQVPETPVVFDCENVEVYYGAFRAVRGVTLAIHAHQITAFIGPSGCGKTTVLREGRKFSATFGIQEGL